jgi:hypothetical protein
MKMLRQVVVRGRIVSHLLVAVAVLVFVGHVCVLPHSDPAAVEANHGHHDESDGAESHQHGSCDATLSQGHVGTSVGLQVVTAVVPFVAVEGMVPAFAALVSASVDRITAHPPPLFLRHRPLLI